MDAIRVSSKKSWRLAVEFLSQAVQDGQQLEPWQRVEWMQLWKPKISLYGVWLWKPRLLLNKPPNSNPFFVVDS